MVETLIVKAGQVQVVDETSEFERAAVDFAEKALSEALADRGTASVALAGGGTPRGMHRLWAASSKLPWGEVDLFFGDERCVPPDDEQSNYRAVLEDFLSALPLPGPRVHRIRGEETDHQRAARRYAAELPDRLDLLILGVGPDGHTASIFPGDAAVLAQTQARAFAVEAPKPPAERITITPPVLVGARKILVLARGEDKAQAIFEARHGLWDPLVTPAQLARRGTFLLDAAAARLEPSA